MCSVYPKRGGSQQDTGRAAETNGGLSGNARSKTTFVIVFTLQCVITLTEMFINSAEGLFWVQFIGPVAELG